MNAPKRWLPKHQLRPAAPRAAIRAAPMPTWRRDTPANPAPAKPRRPRFYDHQTSQKGS